MTDMKFCTRELVSLFVRDTFRYRDLPGCLELFYSERGGYHSHCEGSHAWNETLKCRFVLKAAIEQVAPQHG